MQVTQQPGLGVKVSGFDAGSASHVADLTSLVYEHKIVVLRQQDLTVHELTALAAGCGTLVPYYEEMYHHPECADVFVSSNIDSGAERIGVPKTGKFWHTDYQFMPRPVDITFIYPRVVPKVGRGTFFIDLTTAYHQLPDDLRAQLADVTATHSVAKNFKIRPTDVYRPLGEIIDEINHQTPPVTSDAIRYHRMTGEPLVFVSEGFTQSLNDSAGNSQPELLEQVLDATGQLDPACEHPLIHKQTFEPGDLLVWDNQSLAHRALHTAGTEPAVSYRVTVYDNTTTPVKTAEPL